MNDDFSKRLLEKIEHEHIQPIPPAAILFRKVASWTLLLLSVACTAFLGAIIVLAFYQVDLEFLRASALGPMLRLLLSYLPLVWLAFFVLFFFGELALIRRQPHAYRYPNIAIVGMMLLAAALGGLGFYATRLPERMQASLPAHLPPPMRPWFEHHRPFPRPEDGVLFGRIQEVQTDYFSLHDLPGNFWRVEFDPTRLPEQDSLRVEDDVIVEGFIRAQMIFHADHVRPYHGPANNGFPPRIP